MQSFRSVALEYHAVEIRPISNIIRSTLAHAAVMGMRDNCAQNVLCHYVSCMAGLADHQLIQLDTTGKCGQSSNPSTVAGPPGSCDCAAGGGYTPCSYDSAGGPFDSTTTGGKVHLSLSVPLLLS